MWVGTGFGLLVGAIIKDKSAAISIWSLFFVILMLVSGFFVNADNMVPVMIPVKYLSPYIWGFQAYVLNEYRDLNLSCSPSCNPTSGLGFDETLDESIWSTTIIGFGCYVGAYITLTVIFYRSKH